MNKIREHENIFISKYYRERGLVAGGKWADGESYYIYKDGEKIGHTHRGYYFGINGKVYRTLHNLIKYGRK